MKIAVLGNSPTGSFTELTRAAGTRHQVSFVSWNQIAAVLGSRESILHPGGPFDACLVRGMPVGSLEQVIFQMNVLSRWQACGLPVINSARSLEVAIDKYLSLALIRESGLPVPETMVCQTVPESVRAFQTLGQDVVIKPVFGGEGRGLIRVTDTELALRCFRAIVNVQGVVFLQRFVDSGQQDMRWLVMGDRLIGMLRRNPSDWRTNASRGAKCERLPANPGLEQLASDAAKAVGTVIAGVDIIEDQQGQPWVLEVNGIPGWQKIGETCDVDVAAWVLECMESWVLDPKHPKTRGDSPVKRRPEDPTGE